MTESLKQIKLLQCYMSTKQGWENLILGKSFQVF